jgi:hypothetical protein
MPAELVDRRVDRGSASTFLQIVRPGGTKRLCR